MSQEKPHRSRSWRFGVDFEEDKVSISFYRRVGNPAIADEVMNQIESDPEMKRTHFALYLRCKESLRTQKVRQAHNKRIGQFVRMLSNAVFIVPVIAIQRLLGQSGDIAVECLPEVRKEPAVRQVNPGSRNPIFAGAIGVLPSGGACTTADKRREPGFCILTCDDSGHHRIKCRTFPRQVPYRRFFPPR